MVDPKAVVAPYGAKEVCMLMNCPAVNVTVPALAHVAGNVLVEMVQEIELDDVLFASCETLVDTCRLTVAVPNDPEAPLGLNTATLKPDTAHALGTINAAALCDELSTVEKPLGTPY